MEDDATKLGDVGLWFECVTDSGVELPEPAVCMLYTVKVNSNMHSKLPREGGA